MMAWHTQMLATPSGPALSKHLLDKHFLRKHGPGAYYGQAKEKEALLGKKADSLS
jgi:hypothetical protein